MDGDLKGNCVIEVGRVYTSNSKRQRLCDYEKSIPWSPATTRAFIRFSQLRSAGKLNP
jgi:hypothetical protein